MLHQKIFTKCKENKEGREEQKNMRHTETKNKNADALNSQSQAETAQEN